MVERGELEPHLGFGRGDPPAQLEKRHQAFPPTGLIAFSKVVIPGPCKFQSTREREMSLNRQDQVVLSAKYFNVSAKKVHIFSVTAK